MPFLTVIQPVFPDCCKPLVNFQGPRKCDSVFSCVLNALKEERVCRGLCCTVFTNVTPRNVLGNRKMPLPCHEIVLEKTRITCAGENAVRYTLRLAGAGIAPRRAAARLQCSRRPTARLQTESSGKAYGGLTELDLPAYPEVENGAATGAPTGLSPRIKGQKCFRDCEQWPLVMGS